MIVIFICAGLSCFPFSHFSKDKLERKKRDDKAKQRNIFFYSNVTCLRVVEKEKKNKKTKSPAIVLKWDTSSTVFDIYPPRKMLVFNILAFHFFLFSYVSIVPSSFLLPPRRSSGRYSSAGKGGVKKKIAATAGVRGYFFFLFLLLSLSPRVKNLEKKRARAPTLLTVHLDGSLLF